MIKLLDSGEVSRVSGGWVCNNSFHGKPFLKAAWFQTTATDKSFGACYYGTEDMEISFHAPDALVGIIQEPTNYWSLATDDMIYSIYECVAKNPNKCVFKDA